MRHPVSHKALPPLLMIEQSLRSVYLSLAGAWFSPSDMSTLFQDSGGTTPVTAVTQPDGLVLDKSLGVTLGPELVTNGTFDADITGWAAVIGGTATALWDAGKIRINTVSTVVGFSRSLTTVVGNTYKLVFTVSPGSATARVYINNTNDTSTPYVNYVGLTPGNYVYYFVATTTTTYVLLSAQAAGGIVIFDNISVKLVEGNHALQATAAARPTLQVDAAGFKFLNAAGVDDSLTSATGGGGTAGFMYCAGIKREGGDGTLQTLWSDTGTNTGYKVQFDVNNKLSFSAGDGAAFTTIVSAAAFNVGDKASLKAWDDGANLNVQIGSGAVASVARPVVVAGTAGFTMFKDNGAASSFFIGYLYEQIYWKNTAGTDAQRALADSYVRSKAGL